MKNLRLLTIIATCLLVTSIFAVIPAFSVQPPLDASTYYVGTIGQPVNLDPARAYDTASGEILQNVYQTLVWYGDKHPITFTPGVGYNLQLADYANLSKFQPVLATEVPTIENGRIVLDGAGGANWTFTVNTNALFQPWVAANGTLMAARNLTVDDVVWSFQRQFVIEMSSSPSWMYFMPAFGIMGFRYRSDLLAYSNGTFKNAQNESYVANLIQQYCFASGGNNVTFKFQYAWATTVMYQIFAQTWGSVVNKVWAIEHGDWDGLFTAGWSNNYRRKPAIRFSALDLWKDPAIYGAAGSKYPSGNKDVPNMCGTGPYNFTATNWDQTTKTWRIDRFAQFWQGWGAGAGDGAGNYLSTVIVKGIDAWPTRKMLFLEGEFDVAAVPRANMYDLLSGDAYTPIPGINLVYNVSQLSNDVLLFQFNISTSTAYPAYVGYPGHVTGAPSPEFFANAHIRKAFCWALNYTSYIADAWFGEGIQQASWWVDGLAPALAKNTSITMRNLDYNMIKAELDQAIVDGYNVSQNGFDVTLAYNIGNDQRLIACQEIASAFLTLGSKYHVSVVGLDWPVFLNARDTGALAAYDVGWLADFADPDNFARPYQHSAGDFLWSQGPPYPDDQAIVDAEIDAAIIEQHEADRITMYQDLQYRFWYDAVDMPLIQPVGRRFARDWVQGWYFNSLFPGLYAYHLWKAYPITPQSVTLDITHSITPIVNYSTVYWYKGQMLVGNGNGSNAVFKYSVFTNRTDSNTNVALLTSAISLARYNGTFTGTGGRTDSFAYPNSTIVYIPVGGSRTVVLSWWEAGDYPQFFLAYPNTPDTWSAAYVPPAASFWKVGAIAVPVNATQSDPSLTAINSTTSTIGEGPLKGDIKADGKVNVLDAIRLGLVFGTHDTDSNWNPDANLKLGVDSTGHEVINILDAIVLGLNFNHYYPL